MLSPTMTALETRIAMPLIDIPGMKIIKNKAYMVSMFIEVSTVITYIY